MNEIDSLLNADLSGVDTSFPVIAPGVITGTIADCKSIVSKNGKPMLEMKLTAGHPVMTTASEEKPAGFPFRHNISLTPTEKYNPKQGLAQLKEAVFGSKEGSFGDPASYVGQPVSFRVKIENSDEYGMQNRVAAFVKVAR
jgi:hypothetical protein